MYHVPATKHSLFFKEQCTATQQVLIYDRGTKKTKQNKNEIEKKKQKNKNENETKKNSREHKKERTYMYYKLTSSSGT